MAELTASEVRASKPAARFGLHHVVVLEKNRVHDMWVRADMSMLETICVACSYCWLDCVAGRRSGGVTYGGTIL
jgi:hypothetical protein